MTSHEPTGSASRHTSVRGQPDRDHLAARLNAAWAALDDQGAVVRRRDVDTMPLAALVAALAHEERRIRALAERDLPAPAPFDWAGYRERIDARRRSVLIPVRRPVRRRRAA